mgnify:CR=1 FL=1
MRDVDINVRSVAINMCCSVTNNLRYLYIFVFTRINIAVNIHCNKMTDLTPTQSTTQPSAQQPLQETITGRDAMAIMERNAAEARDREIKLQEAAQKAERDRQLLQKHIYDNANPPPLLIVTIGLGVLLTMWILYMLYLKPDASGEWIDDMNNKFIFTHNKFTGNVKVRVNGKCGGYAKLIDNYFRYGELIGVWDYADNISCLNGMQLTRFL